MNKTKEILEYLASSNIPRTLVIAPNAQPITRGGSREETPFQEEFTDTDIEDTLQAFSQLGPLADSSVLAPSLGVSSTRPKMLNAEPSKISLTHAGSFSMGIRKVGRFRINYMTQRGSKVISVSRIPIATLDPEEVCDDQALLDQLNQSLSEARRGLLVICGPQEEALNLMAYALFRKMNQNEKRLLYLLERSINYMIGHRNSIVIQRELNTDFSNLEEGVRDAFPFRPDLLYVGDLRPSDELPSLGDAVRAGIFTVVSSTAMNGGDVLAQLPAGLSDQGRPYEGEYRAVLKVQPADEHKVNLHLDAGER